MKKIMYCLILFASAVVSCSDEVTEGLSRTTYYPIFEVTGDEEIFSETGTPYEDPGAEATEGGEPIEVTTFFSGDYFGVSGPTLDINAPDRYSVEYTAVNVDGIAATAHRTVWRVGEGDFAPNIEGLYISTVARNGVTPVTAIDMEYIIIKKTGANTYTVSDAIGGWYDIHRGLGLAYITSDITFTLNDIATNSISSTSESPMGIFGGACELQSMTFDTVNKKITMTTQCVDPTFNYTFVSSLTQVSLPL